MENLPLSANFVENIRYPNGCLHRLVVLPGPGKVLNAPCDTELAVGDDRQLDEFALYVLSVVEKIVEVTADSLSSGVLQWRNEVVKHNIVGVIAGHRVLSIGRRDTFVLEI